MMNTETRAPAPAPNGGTAPPGRTERSSDTLAVSSGPAEAQEAFDLSTDVAFSAGQEPRAIWVNGSGSVVNVKVDGFKRDGSTVSTAVVYNITAPGPLPVGRVSKIYSNSNGSTASAGIVALW